MYFCPTSNALELMGTYWILKNIQKNVPLREGMGKGGKVEEGLWGG